MRILITTEGTSERDMVSQVFGRCRNLLLVEADGKGIISSTEAVGNDGAHQEHGAGIRTAEQAASFSPDAIFTPALGPKATSVLENANIPVYKAEGMISEAVKAFVNGELEALMEDNSPQKQKDARESKKGERFLFPLIEDNGMESRISEHFGHAPYLGVYDEKDGSLSISENTLVHSDPSKSPVEQVMEQYTPTAVVGIGMGKRAITLFMKRGVKLLNGGGFKTINDILKNIETLDVLSEACG